MGNGVYTIWFCIMPQAVRKSGHLTCCYIINGFLVSKCVAHARLNKYYKKYPFEFQYLWYSRWLYSYRLTGINDGRRGALMLRNTAIQFHIISSIFNQYAQTRWQIFRLIFKKVPYWSVMFFCDSSNFR